MLISLLSETMASRENAFHGKMFTLPLLHSLLLEFDWEGLGFNCDTSRETLLVLFQDNSTRTLQKVPISVKSVCEEDARYTVRKPQPMCG